MTNTQKSDRKRVVIVGGGFGGLEAAKALANQSVDVILVDRKNHYTFQPLLYQVAAGVLAPSQIAAPLRQVLSRARNIEILLDDVTDVDLAKRTISVVHGGEIAYDFLIVAAGARHSYFGHNEWEADAPGLKTLEDATDIRKRILLAFERAEREQALTGNHTPLSFAIVGGGPTGVELAGVIADISRRIVATDYHSIDTTKARVMLFEGSSRVLGAFPEDLSASAEQQLKELGVEVFTNSLVNGIEADRVLVGENWIPVSTVLWASGVAASPLGKSLSDNTDRAGRTPVQPDLSLPNHPEAFVIGDMALLTDINGTVVPGLGAAAMQMGTAAAESILGDLRSEPRKPFAYRDKGTMATIGKHRAVAKIGRLKLTGLPAWLLWGAVHVVLLIGFRNRLSVLREWILAYVTGRFSSRLITGDPDGD